MTIEKDKEITEELEELGYYEGDWKISKNQKHNGCEWVWEHSVTMSEDMRYDYEDECGVPRKTEFIRLGLGFYLI